MLNMLWDKVDSSSGNSNRKPAGLGKGRSLQLEQLESRNLMATSAWVAPGQDGHLIYQPTANGDRIPDFANVGYQAGHDAIPTNLPVRATVAPRKGDDGAAIQTAIDAVSILPLDANGFRGIVQLRPGEYQIAGQLNIWASGVVLRGAGDSQGGTILRATGTVRRSLINVAGTGYRQGVPGTQHKITSSYVPVGARSLHLDSTAGLAVGETIVVRRPSTQAWINALGMNQLANSWQPDDKDIQFDRVITRIEGDWITLDAPLTSALDQKFGGGTVIEYVWPGRLENIGVEHLRGVSDFKYATDDNHAWTFVEIRATQNAWVKDITTQHFAYGAVSLQASSKWVTVEDAQCLDPKSQLIGGRRYAFFVQGQQNLVRNAVSRGSRHDFVLGGYAAGPNVFVDCWAQGSLNDTGPHARWSVGTLLDNVNVPGNQINIRNRGNMGDGHGWTAANSVVWNSKAGSFIVDNPPTAQNWLIGSSGGAGNSSCMKDSHGKPVTLRSLYYAQLAERQSAPGLEAREYWLGDIDQHRAGGEANSADAWSDPAWLAEVNAATSGQVMGMDQFGANRWVPLTFDFNLAPGEQVVSATLSLGVRATAGNVSTNRVFFDSLGQSRTISELKWGSIPTGGAAARTVDLTAYLSALQDGQFNLALGNDLAVDWAALNIQVAPAGHGAPALFSVSGDATVHGGLHANSNYGSIAGLAVMPYTGTQEARQSYISFDLSNLSGGPVQAIVRLRMLDAAPSVTNSAAIVTDDWDESSITWNNKPGSGQTLASWTGETGGMASIDVSEQINLLRAQGYTKLSLRIFSSGGTGAITYGSRESDVFSQPLLEVIGV